MIGGATKPRVELSNISFLSSILSDCTLIIVSHLNVDFSPSKKILVDIDRDNYCLHSLSKCSHQLTFLCPPPPIMQAQ